MKFKWIAGLVSVCLVTATVAAGLTAVLLINGVIGPGLQRMTAGSDETTKPESTSIAKQTTTGPIPSPTPRPTPTVKPTISPTPVLSPAPSGFPTPTIDPTTHSALEDLYLWQVHDLLERIYASVSQSVAGIKLEVGGTSTASKMTNEGSGVIITSTGEIAINASLLSIALDKQGKVLASAKINVHIKDIDTPFAATLVGRDLMTGLAVLHINPGSHTLQPARFAEKTTLQIGQMILTVGYPEQVYASGCMSSGFISGLHYPVVLEDGTTLQMIQTNAPISASCLGGPLLNLEGEAIGLTCSAPNLDISDPMSYALPGQEALRICMDLIDKGYVTGRSWLGVTVFSEQSFLDLQKMYNLPDGLFISNIIKGSPAASVDLRQGDVITRIDDKKIGTSTDLGRFMQSQPVGTLIVIRVYRRSDGQYHDIDVYLQEYTS
jgi:S1-C subfamily serine protease